MRSDKQVRKTVRRTAKLLPVLDAFMQKDNPDIDLGEVESTYVLVCLLASDRNKDVTQIAYNIDATMFEAEDVAFETIKDHGGKLSLVTHMLHQNLGGMVKEAMDHVYEVCKLSDAVDMIMNLRRDRDDSQKVN